MKIANISGFQFDIFVSFELSMMTQNHLIHFYYEKTRKFKVEKI